MSRPRTCQPSARHGVCARSLVPQTLLSCCARTSNGKNHPQSFPRWSSRSHSSSLAPIKSCGLTVDVTSRSTVRIFCRSLQTWTPRGKRALAGLTCHSACSIPCKGVSGGDRGTEMSQTPGWTHAPFQGSFKHVCTMLAPRLPEYTPGFYVRLLAWDFQTACVVKIAQRRFF